MKEVICIVCPKGCHLQVDETSLNVTGNSCIRGIEYGINEVTNPTRMLTTTMKVISKEIKRVPVITSKEIPKSKLFEAMEVINKITIYPPIRLHQILIHSILGLDIDIIATRSIEK